MKDINRVERLRYRSWHRGTREMDLLMGSFADKYLLEFSAVQLDQYEDILQQSDPDLYNWITGIDPLTASQQTEVMQMLCTHSYAKKLG